MAQLTIPKLASLPLGLMIMRLGQIAELRPLGRKERSQLSALSVALQEAEASGEAAELARAFRHADERSRKGIPVVVLMHPMPLLPAGRAWRPFTLSLRSCAWLTASGMAAAVALARTRPQDAAGDAVSALLHHLAHAVEAECGNGMSDADRAREVCLLDQVSQAVAVALPDIATSAQSYLTGARH